MLKPTIKPDANIPIIQSTKGPVIRVYTSGNYTYYCKSTLSEDETNPCWSIKRVEQDKETGKIVELWAYGISNEVFKASLRETYIYK